MGDYNTSFWGPEQNKIEKLRKQSTPNVPTTQWARKFKKVHAKKLVKSNESISRIIFLTKFHFLQFQQWPKSNF